MRALVFGLAVIAIAWIARADAPVPAKKTAPAGFDHGRHAQAAAAVTCVQCHALDRGLVGKPPGHATCFGKCHGELAATLKLREAVPDDRVKYCNACHAETALVSPVDKKAIAATAVSGGIDHATQLGHNSHAQIACTRCHDPGRARRGRPHERCIGCHGDRADKTFAIGDCAKCHPAGNDKPHLARPQIVVTSAFSHAKHASRGTAKQCGSCHAGIVATDSRVLPTPKLATCTSAGCHDGKAAFGAQVACTRCHQDAPKGEFVVERPDATFSHAKHESRTKQPCTGCHTLSKAGEIHAGGHLSCIEGCHQHDAEFGAAKPTICGACHDGTEPWRPLIADKLPRDATEFGATLDHGKHAATACTSCHSLTTSRTELRAPRGHRSCTTAGCHAVKGGPAPQMADCETCHQRDLAAKRETARLTARWSVRATFRHRSHAAKTEVACAGCHTSLIGASVLALPAPTKASCAAAGCHDGSGAFKVTGTSCTRCHPGASK